MTKQQAPAVRAGTRKERKLLARQIWSDKPGLEVVHKDAAGIDVGSKEHYEQAHCQRKLKALAKQAAQQGFQLVPA